VRRAGIAEPECSLGLGGVAPEVEQHLPNALCTSARVRMPSRRQSAAARGGEGEGDGGGGIGIRGHWMGFLFTIGRAEGSRAGKPCEGRAGPLWGRVRVLA
jgi:hypothetical protein